MEELKQYLLSVITVALICAVVQTFQQGPSKTLAQLVCGLILTVTVVKPVLHFDFSASFDSLFSLSGDAQENAAEGEKMSRDALSDIIKEETEAYIQDKANELGAEISADVIVSDNDIPVPVAAVIRGALTAYARDSLEEVLCTELGIAKENLTWIG